MSFKTHVYLDANAGVPPSLKVQEALQAFFSSKAPVANPSSIHFQGRQARRLLSEAREKVAFSIGAHPQEVIFTSSGTEANQLVIRSVLETHLSTHKKTHWILTPVEHDSTRQMIEWLKNQGGEVDFLPLDQCGIPQAKVLKDKICPETALVSSIWANNETGLITPIEKLGEICEAFHIPLHLDAAQVWGKLPIQVQTIKANYLTFSGHKIGSFGGVGAVWVKNKSPIHPFIFGKQEKGRRGGTENLIGIMSLGVAASHIDPLQWDQRVRRLRDQLEEEITQRIPGTHIHGALGKRIANTSNLSFEGVQEEGLILALDLEGYSLSAGSACSSGVLEPSHVLMAMGQSAQAAMAAVRISMIDEIPWEDLQNFVTVLEKSVERIRQRKS